MKEGLRVDFTNSLYMDNRGDVRVAARLRKVGSSLAILIPARIARKAGLHVGDLVDATLSTNLPPILGFNQRAGLARTTFDRHKDMEARDRI